jgi:cyclase
VVNTHEDGDHVWGNQLFKDAEIIAHRSMPEAMKRSADPDETLKLQHAVEHYLTRMLLKGLHPGVAAVASQLHEDFDFEGIELTLPTTLFDTRYELDLDGTAVHILYVGPCHSTGDTSYTFRRRACSSRATCSSTTARRWGGSAPTRSGSTPST